MVGGVASGAAWRVHGRGPLGWQGLSESAACEVLRQILIGVGDFLRIGSFSFRPLNHLLDLVSGMAIFIDPDAGIQDLAEVS